MNPAGFITKWRFSLLLLALIFNILLAPLVADLNLGATLGSIAIQIAFTFLLIIIVFVAGHNKKIVTAYIILACTALIFSWLSISNNTYPILLANHLFSFIALALAIILIIKEALLSECVTLDTIAASLCAYLLLGFAFASIYALIDIIEPNSFISSIHGSDESISLALSDLDRIYFSFVTMLTVGYGDIVPHSPPAKLTTIIEGFVGQVYLVVLIARLVGVRLHSTRLVNQTPAPPDHALGNLANEQRLR